MSGFTPRLPWARLPRPVHDAVDDVLGEGSGVISARDVHGGMSAGPAAVLTLADGRTVFAKVTAATTNARTHDLYRSEISAYRALGAVPGLPAPRLMGCVRHGPWLAIVTTLAPGRTPGPPWEPGALPVVASAVDRVSRQPAPDGVPPVLRRLPDLDGWTNLLQLPHALDDWEREHAARCSQVTRGWRRWTAGAALAHHDLRCDNVLVDGDQAVLVDWAFASAAAPWLDRALLAADVVGSDVAQGADPVALALGILDGAAEEAARFVVAQVGMMRRNSLRPDHPGMPTFRSWQAARAWRSRPLVEALLARLDR